MGFTRSDRIISILLTKTKKPFLPVSGLSRGVAFEKITKIRTVLGDNVRSEFPCHFNNDRLIVCRILDVNHNRTDFNMNNTRSVRPSPPPLGYNLCSVSAFYHRGLYIDYRYSIGAYFLLVSFTKSQYFPVQLQSNCTKIIILSKTYYRMIWLCQQINT